MGKKAVKRVTKTMHARRTTYGWVSLSTEPDGPCAHGWCSDPLCQNGGDDIRMCREGFRRAFPGLLGRITSNDSKQRTRLKVTVEVE